MYLKAKQRQLLLRLIASCTVLFLLFELPITVLGDKGEPVNPIPPNEILGLADANTGLEAGHLPPNGGYQNWFQANYDQTENVGVQWNRWAVKWSQVESSANPNQLPEYHWFCVWDGVGTAPEECEGNADRYDYPRLAQEDEARGVNSLVVLTEIPNGYQTSPDGSRIAGLNTGIFQILPNGTTDDPNHPNINHSNPINTNNRWGAYFYQATIVLGDAGVHHWQIMNEMNLSEAWSSQQWRNDYVRVVEVADKVLQYRQRFGEALEDQIIIGGSIYVFPEDNPDAYAWVLLMYQQLAIQMADPDIAPFSIDAVALHTYDRNRTSYDYPTTIYDHLEELDSQYQVNLSSKPLWLTETGSSSCADEVIPDNCPPMEGGTPRSTDEEQSYYIVQSLAYAQSLPQMDKYFQFHLHEGCPHGIGEQTGYGLFHNWAFYQDAFNDGGDNVCAIGPHNGREKPANQAFSLSSRWLRDFNGYSVPGSGSPVEFLIFPAGNSQRTYVAWSRIKTDVDLVFYSSPGLSGGPLLAISPDGTTELLYADWGGRYSLALPKATNPIEAQEDDHRIIGGKPFIILEHVLFDLGAKPAIFAPEAEAGNMRFGLNLPAGMPQATVNVTVYAENDDVVWTASGTFSNGEHGWLWDGLDDTTGEPVANGLYRYEITLSGLSYTTTGFIGVSQPGIRACFFNTSTPDPHPPSPNVAFVDYRGSAIYPAISFDWEGNPPIPELDDNDNWIARYVGYVQVEDEGVYQFRLKKMDDVARLFVDGALIVMPDWVENGGEPFDRDSPEIYLSEGLHTIVVEHAQVTNLSSLTLQWHKDGWILPWWTVDTLWQPGGDLTATCEATNGPVSFLNGDFEDGFNHWTRIPDPPEPIWGWHLNEYVAHGGQYGAEGRVHLRGNYPTYLISDAFTVANNRCYQTDLFFQAYFDLGYEDTLFHVVLNWYDDNGTLLSSSELLELPFSNIPANWYFFTGQATAPQGSEDAEILFYLEPISRVQNSSPSGQGANIFVDDVVIDYCP